MIPNILDKVLLAIKSRTAWTIVAIFVINGITGIHDFINPSVLTILDPILGLLAIYFRVNPRV